MGVWEEEPSSLIWFRSGALVRLAYGRSNQAVYSLTGHTSNVRQKETKLCSAVSSADRRTPPFHQSFIPACVAPGLHHQCLLLLSPVAVLGELESITAECWECCAPLSVASGLLRRSAPAPRSWITLPRISLRSKHERISIGCFISLCSKHALFLAFQVAQQMAAKPNVCMKLPPGRDSLIHLQYWLRFPGMLLVPKHTAIHPQTTLTVEHWKKRWSRVSTLLQKRQVGSPTQFLLNMLSFVKVAPCSRS